MEIEVFRLMEANSRVDFPNYSESHFFNVDRCYEYAKYTRQSGRWPNERFFTRNPMQYVGRYVRSERWGNGDGRGGDEVFNNNGTEVRISLDYDGTASFREVPCREGGGAAAATNTSTASTATTVTTAPTASIATKALVSATNPNIKDEDLCVVCLEREKTNAFVPCGHMCVCGICGPEIMRTTHECPICRSNSSTQLHIYKTKYLKYKNKYLQLKNEFK